MGYTEFGRFLAEEQVENYIVFAIPGIPEIKANDDLGEIICAQTAILGGFIDGDVVVIASKVVSKAEGRVVDTASLLGISQEAEEVSRQTGKPPAVCQVILDQAAYHYVRGRTIIVKHKLGYLLTSAGVDRLDDRFVTLIPENPDVSATRLRERIESLSNKELAVVISDSEGREDRLGAGAIALGVSGINPLRISESPNQEGVMKQSQETLSDLLSSAGNIILGQRGKLTPVACLRGIKYNRDLNTGVLDILLRGHSKIS